MCAGYPFGRKRRKAGALIGQRSGASFRLSATLKKNGGGITEPFVHVK